MDKICRLCLKASDDMSFKLDKNTNITLCCFKIQLHDSLPNNICCKCHNIFENLESFLENVTKNQNKLKELLKNESYMNEFYDNIKNQCTNGERIIKNEKTEMLCADPFYDEVLYTNLSDVNFDIENVPNNNSPMNLEGDNILHENSAFLPNCYIQKNHTMRHLKKRWQKKKKTCFKPNARKTVQEKQLVNNETISCAKTDLAKEVLDKKPLELNDNFDNNETNISDINLGLSLKRFVEFNDNEPKVIKTEATHLEVSINTCLTCFKNHASRKHLIEHYRTEHNSQIEKKIKVESNELESTAGIVKKEAVNDNSCKPYICKICGRTYINLQSMVDHGRVHSNDALYCSHRCGYTTVYKGALNQHEKLHTKDFKYKCNICGAGFQVKSWHNQHQNVHNKIKPFTCDLCGKAFFMDRYLQAHRANRHPEIYLRAGKPRFTCLLCGNGFINKLSFKNHMENHNGKRKFLCDICGKEFATKELLKYHNNSHLGVKPFSCSICNKKFARKFNLTVHERAHAGERHLCQICGKYFVQRSTLLRHTRQFHANNENTQKNNEKIKRDENNQETNIVLSTNTSIDN